MNLLGTPVNKDKRQTVSIADSESQIAKTRLILGDEDRGRLRPYGATLGLYCGISLEQTRHRDLYVFQVGLGIVNGDTLQIRLLHSHPDSVDAAQEQFGRKVRRNLDIGLRRCPECRLQPPRDEAFEHDREHQKEEEPYQNQ